MNEKSGTISPAFEVRSRVELLYTVLQTAT